MKFHIKRVFCDSSIAYRVSWLYEWPYHVLREQSGSRFDAVSFQIVHFFFAHHSDPRYFGFRGDFTLPPAPVKNIEGSVGKNARLFGWSSHLNTMLWHSHCCLRRRFSCFRNEKSVLKERGARRNYVSRRLSDISQGSQRNHSGEPAINNCSLRDRGSEREKGALVGQAHMRSGGNEPITWPKKACGCPGSSGSSIPQKQILPAPTKPEEAVLKKLGDGHTGASIAVGVQHVVSFCSWEADKTPALSAYVNCNVQFRVV